MSASRRVSVLVAAFRAQRWLENCVMSLVDMQIPKGWTMEICIGVDGCPETLETANKLCSVHPGIKVFEFPHTGCYPTRNALFEVATGDVFLILDADDWAPRDRLLKQLQLLDDYDMVVGAYQECDADLAPEYTVPAIHPSEAYRAGPPGRLPSHGTWCFHRGVIDVLGGYEEWSCGADMDFILRAIAIGVRVGVVEDVCYRHRQHPQSLLHAPKTRGGSPERVHTLQTIYNRWRRYLAGAGVEHVFPQKTPCPISVSAARRNVVGILPTIPERVAGAAKVMRTMLSQGVDLVVYLNGHEKVPAEFPISSHISYQFRPPKTGPFVRYEKASPGYSSVILLDDDVAYPRDYVEVVLDQLEHHQVVTFHGSYWPSGFSSYSHRVETGGRKVIPYFAGSTEVFEVPFAASGFLAMRGSVLDVVAGPPMQEFEYEDDVWISAQLAQHGIPVVRPTSPENWVSRLDTPGASLWQQTLDDDFVQRDAAIRLAQSMFPLFVLGDRRVVPKP